MLEQAPENHTSAQSAESEYDKHEQASLPLGMFLLKFTLFEELEFRRNPFDVFEKK